MRKWKNFFAMAGLIFLFSISVFSCQTNDVDDYPYPQEAVDLTAADLFIASEAYHNLEKEIGKDMRRERNAIAKLSKEELEQYHVLRKELLNNETRAEANDQLKNLTGYDYQKNRDRISSLVREVFKDVDFTKLELMRARQKSRMHKVAITRAETNEELCIKCKNDCEDTAKTHIVDCHNDFNENIKDLPASEFPNGSTYRFYETVRDICISAEEDQKTNCKEECDRKYKDEK